MTETAASRAIEIWKMKTLVKNLRDARGAGTSMISLISPPGSQVCQLQRLLTEEYGTAVNIKSRVNRLSVLDAITSTQQRLKMFSKIPSNGLLLFCGTILTHEGKEKRVTMAIEPFKPINTSLYMCDNRFHVEALNELLEDEDVYGFIIMNGEGCLYGTVRGNTRTVLQQISVELPKKHGRGGQSSVRFARLRMEARHNYVRKVAELATHHFIIDNCRCSVKGLILAGSADFKTELSKSDLFDARLSAKIVTIVDIAYGGMSGFNQAIQLAAEAMGNVRFVQEKKLLYRFFSEIHQDTGKICFSLRDTMRALERGAVEILILWEQLPTECFLYKHKTTGEIQVAFPFSIPDSSHWELNETLPFIEWMANSYQNFGTQLEFVTDCSSEGNQFVKGFGGIGGLLRWKLEEDEEEWIAMEELTATTAAAYDDGDEGDVYFD